MSVKQRRWGCILALAVFLGLPLFASASPELRKSAILSTMTESALSTVSLLQKRLGENIEDFHWYSTYSDRDFFFSGHGRVGDKKVAFEMTGYLWGAEQQNLSLTYSGFGDAGNERVRINGRSDWPFDKSRADYINMDFSQVIKFGENSKWGWVKGSEVIVGGALGAGSALALAGAATGGTALVGAFFIGGMGAATGADIFLSISNELTTLDESHEPTAPPKEPERPSAPDKGQSVEIAPGQILTAVSKDGKLLGAGPGELSLSGFYDKKANHAKGEISVIKRPPERLTSRSATASNVE